MPHKNLINKSIPFIHAENFNEYFNEDNKLNTLVNQMACLLNIFHTLPQLNNPTKDIIKNIMKIEIKDLSNKCVALCLIPYALAKRYDLDEQLHIELLKLSSDKPYLREILEGIHDTFIESSRQ